MPSSKKRAQGGGRTANSEPRQQVFKEFGGCNFELSPREFTLGKDVYQEQSDLQMNFVVVQNNAGITSNKTIETRNNLELLYGINDEDMFSGACVLVGNKLYLGTKSHALLNGDIHYVNINNPSEHGLVEVDEKNTRANLFSWSDLDYIDDKLIALSSDGMLYTGDINTYEIANAKEVPDPEPLLFFEELVTKGNLDINDRMDDAHPYRVALAYTYINKYGPTKHSNQVTFYANYPVDEWHGGRYLSVEVLRDSTFDQYEIQALEFYFTTGNSSSLLFAGRTDAWVLENGYKKWIFDWFGYLDATSMWPVANLIAPEQNYTMGPHATQVTCIDSRVYFWGDDEQPQRLYIGGNSGNLFSISPGTGGGFVDIEPGTGQKVKVVTKYKTQSGASIVTMLCSSDNSTREQRFNLVENSVSLSNEQSMKSWQAEQVAGAVGCKSLYGAVVCEDGLYAVSRYGVALTTMTMEYNSQIRTTYISDPIKPVFIDKNMVQFSYANLIECDGVLYMAIGNGGLDLKNMLFCYDIDQKAWWTITLDIDEPIVRIFHLDYQGYREGIGVITQTKVYLLPLTKDDAPTVNADFPVTIQTGELATQQPQQNWIYLSQLEFRFDYFIGSVLVELTGIDQFGRKVTTKKQFSHDSTVYNLAEYMRVDLRLQSYQIRITGQARFRMTHFIAKVYTMSAKQGLVWGFDDSQSFRTDGDIHPTFKDYNDIERAIIP